MLRCARRQDIMELKELWREAFSEEEGFLEDFFKNRALDLQNILVKTDILDKEIISMLYMLPCYVECKNKQIIRAVNVVGVATISSQRHKGHMSDLISFMFDIMRERSIEAAFLKPSKKEFYERYGFRMCADIYEAEIDIKNAEIFDGKYASEDLIRRVDKIYRNVPVSGCRMLRSFEDWKFHIKESRIVIRDDFYAICGKENNFSEECVPRIKGEVTGCIMCKFIDPKKDCIDERDCNLLFEQY